MFMKVHILYIPLNIQLLIYEGKGKVKFTLVQAPRLCTGRTARSGSRGIALPFHDHGIEVSEG
jgi:hypothetical protein